jgi:hypothetical protein
MLTAGQIRTYGWISPDAAKLWDDVLHIADQVHVADTVSRQWAWHHLLLATANFKADRKVFPAPLPPRAEATTRVSPLDLKLPQGVLVLDCEDAETWPRLTDMHGLGVSRASAVLAALWPYGHAIIDWRALSIAAALAGVATGWTDPLPAPEATHPLSVRDPLARSP